MLKIAVLVSGGGTNLEALFRAEDSGTLKNGKITLVVSDRPGAYALERAKKRGIKALTVERGECFEETLVSLLEGEKTDLIVLAGFLSILSPAFTRRYDKKIINIHPSLIPSFCGDGFYGLKVHRAALECGVKLTGATVHFVNEITDGGEIIMQKAVEVREGDTPEVLQRRVMEEAEWIILPLAVEKICAERGNNMKNTLIGNQYPGRGIIIGTTPNGKYAVTAYFIMGRSVNSRNRLFEETADGIRTAAIDPSLLSDPSLIIYNPVRKYQNKLIVTNGDQTDTIFDYISEGKSFEEALTLRCYEPDAPNFTPRISGMLTFSEGSFSYTLSILKKNGENCLRCFYCFEAPTSGMGHLIHTYEGDNNPLPSFCGEPREYAVSDCIDSFTQELWNSLDSENRVSLYVNYTDLKTGDETVKIINGGVTENE